MPPGVDGFGVPHWQGLICRDYDEPAGYDQWREGHESLAAELPTVRTSRGVRVYATAPDASYISHATLGDGELIAGPKHYSVFPHSLHPKGGTYTWVNPWRWPPQSVDPVECGFVPKSLSPLGQTVPYPSGLGEPPEWIWDTSHADLISSPGLPTPEAIHVAIARTLPLKKGQRDLKVLELVRALRRAGVASLEEGVPHLRRWWHLAQPVIGTKPYDVTFQAFRRAWDNFNPSLDRFEVAVTAARAAPPPPEAVGVYKASLISLATLCRELQRVVGPTQPFFLSREDAARAIGVRHPKQAGRYLETLCGDGLLRRMHPGVLHPVPALRRAAKWFWTGSM